MGLVIALLVTSTIPQSALVEDYVDVIELNHVYDNEGKPVLSQFIFWNRTDSGFEIVAWRLYCGESISRSNRNCHVILVQADTFRKVNSLQFKETWTQYDPEMRERTKLPINQRLGLTRLYPPSPKVNVNLPFLPR